MQLFIRPTGRIECLYEESLDPAALGAVAIRRASHVEPDDSGRWWADLSPIAVPKLGPFLRRSDALAAESQWIQNWLSTS